MPHLKAGNSEAAGVVRRSDGRHEVGAVGYVLVVELHRDLVVTWRRARRERDSEGERQQTNVRRTQLCVCALARSTGLLGDVRDAAGSVFAVVEGDLRPAGSFHGDGQTAGPCLPRPDAELGW